MNRFQTAALSALVSGAAISAVVLTVPGTNALAILRAAGLLLTGAVVLGYARFFDPRPFFAGRAESRHLIGAGIVFFSLAILISLSRATFFDGICPTSTRCYNLVLAAQAFFYAIALLMLIAGPFVYTGLKGRERWLFRWSIVVASVVAGMALVVGLT